MEESHQPTEQNEQESLTLNSLEFPRLMNRSDVTSLTVSPLDSSSSLISSATSSQRQMAPKKRTLEGDSTHDDSSTEKSSSGNSSFSPPQRKNRKLSYREPNASHDTDSLQKFFELPLSDSLGSDTGSWAMSLSSLTSSIPPRLMPEDSLGSFGDMMQKATLNSLKSLDAPFDFSDNAQSSPIHFMSPPGQHQVLENSDSGGVKLNSDIESSGNKLSDSRFEVKEKRQFLSTEVVYQRTDGDNKDVGYNIKTSYSALTETCKFEVTPSTTSGFSQEILPKASQDSSSSEFLPKASQDSSSSEFLPKASQDSSSSQNDIQVHTTQPSKTYVAKSKTKKDVDDDEDDDFFEEFCSDAAIRKVAQRCKKNPGHPGYFLCGSLKVTHLPREIQHEDSLTFLNCMSDLVVQISVSHTSASRPKNDAYRKYIGTGKKRNGSGFVASIEEHIRKTRCKIEDCPYGASAANDSYSSSEDVPIASPEYHRSVSNISNASISSTSSSPGSDKHFFYSGVRIRTNKHVIYDNSEAEKAYVKFFYNSVKGKEVVEGHVQAIAGVNDSQDHVIVYVVSHDKSLFNRLGLCLRNAKTSYEQMVKSTLKSQVTLSHMYNHSWAVVISHPHGMPKLISIGRVQKEEVEITRVKKYYDADTCPGSSGGLVITPTLLKLQWPGAVHSYYDKKEKLNVTLDSRFPDMDITDLTRIHSKTLMTKRDSYPENIFKL